MDMRRVHKFSLRLSFIISDWISYSGFESGAGPIIIYASHDGDYCHLLMRRSIGFEYIYVDKSQIKRPLSSRLLQLPVRVQDILKALDCKVKSLKKATVPMPIHKPKSYKFGIMPVRAEDQDELDIMRTSRTSSAMDKFVNFLGTRINLFGWSYYNGGLDTTTNITGEQAVYRFHEGVNEVIFHVSTMIKQNVADDLCISRKRFIGNDIVNILFHEEDTRLKRLIEISSSVVQCAVQVCMVDGGTFNVKVFLRQPGCFLKDLQASSWFNMDDPYDSARFVNLCTPSIMYVMCTHVLIVISCERKCFELEPLKSKMTNAVSKYLERLVKE